MPLRYTSVSGNVLAPDTSHDRLAMLTSRIICIIHQLLPGVCLHFTVRQIKDSVEDYRSLAQNYPEPNRPWNEDTRNFTELTA